MSLLRYKVKPYRDDEDEITFESWMLKTGTDLASEIAGYIFPLCGSETVGGLLNAFVHKDTTSDFADSMILSTASDFFYSITKLGVSLSDGEFDLKSAQRILKLFLEFLGVPAGNVERIIYAIKYHAEDIINGEFFSFEADKNKK
jgi:hypothetical protein